MEALADALWKKKTRWCRKDAAKMLGISLTKALLYKMRQFNLDTPRTRKGSCSGGWVVEEPASVVGPGARLYKTARLTSVT